MTSSHGRPVRTRSSGRQTAEVDGSAGSQLRAAWAIALLAILAILYAPAPAPAAEPPTAVLSSTIPTTESTAELSGTIDIHGGPETYLFAQESTDQNSWETKLIALIGSGTTGATPFTYTVERLAPGTTYYFRLLTYSEESGELNTPSEPPYPKATTVVGTPVVSLPATSAVGTSEATLGARIQSRGGATTYQFEYLPALRYESEGWASALVRTSGQLGPVPADTSEHAISYRAGGLTPAERYVWRVTAQNAAGTSVSEVTHFRTWGIANSNGPSSPDVPASTCRNEPFRVGPGSGLPDCRAYELVSPADKHGQSVEYFLGNSLVSDLGDAATFLSLAGTGIPGGEGGMGEFPTYLSRRSAGVWTTARVTPSQALGDRGGFVGATPDLRYVFLAGAKVGTGPGTGLGLFELDTVTGSAATVVPWGADQLGAPRYNNGTGNYFVVGTSPDGSRVFFETEARLTPGAAPEHQNLYMWERSSGRYKLVGVLPGLSEEAPPGGSRAGFIGDAESVQSYRAIPAEGTKAFFTSGETRQLYLRRNLDGTATTVRISAPNLDVAEPDEERPAEFQEAGPGGEHVFFLSSQRLTSDAVAGKPEEANDLFRWDEASGRLVDITPDPAEGNGAEVLGLLGASEDGRSGYLVAKGVLASGGEAGKPNIYRFEEGPGGFRFATVATLRPKATFDSSNWARIEEEVGRGSRVTPDGTVLLFRSVQPLTGFESRGLGPQCEENGRCSEIFRYSSVSGRLQCVSCDPTGQIPIGGASLVGLTEGSRVFKMGVPAAPILSRNLSTDGNRVFFQTPDPLVASDTNGTGGCGIVAGQRSCQDVYEWEAVGTGSCVLAEAEGGCIYLLSSGQSSEPSVFLGATTSGDSAFMQTTSQLVPSDTDSNADVYDAQVDGGLASQYPQGSHACQGESCQGAAAVPPSLAASSSASLVGPGNSKAKKKHHKKKHHKKKHHKKKHHKKKHRSAGKSATTARSGANTAGKGGAK